MVSPVTPTEGALAQHSRIKWRVPASVTLAQYGLESSWGRCEPAGSCNGFGIQELPGLPFVTAVSFEYIKGVRETVTEHFARFSSLADAFDWHGRLLATNPVYRDAMAVANDPDQFVIALAKHYATAPSYSTALISLMRSDNLYAWDLP